VIDGPTRGLDERALRALVPRVLAGLVRRGEDFDAAEDALQEALLEALRVWPEQPPRDPRAWLATVATRRLVDARRSEAARHRREPAAHAEPRPAAAAAGDDTLLLLSIEPTNSSLVSSDQWPVEPMTIQRMEHVDIVVDDLAAATAFFVELGLKLQGGGPVEGGWADRVVGAEGVRAKIIGVHRAGLPVLEAVLPSRPRRAECPARHPGGSASGAPLATRALRVAARRWRTSSARGVRAPRK
jgi:DNA-directed RNA polymerase specialized sigma24 family protein